MNVSNFLKIATLGLAVAFTACRGQRFEEPPIHPNMNMDQQHRIEAQEKNRFFTDNRGMRQPVEGTVARGHLRNNKALYQGITEDSNFVSKIPLKLTRKLLEAGQDQYNIYCTPCHGIAGDGQGILVTGKYGIVPPPSYHIDRLRNVNDGYIYSVISNGIRTMRPYAHQIPVRDRWAIVAYVRALQRSQNVQEEEIQKYDVDLAAMKEEARQTLADKQAKKQAAEAASAGAQITAAKGKEIAASNACTTCHSADGSKGVGPTWKNLYGHEVKLASGETVIADEAYLTESIVNATAKTVAGYPEGAMANFSYLSSTDIENIIAYIKSLSDKKLEAGNDSSKANTN